MTPLEAPEPISALAIAAVGLFVVLGGLALLWLPCALGSLLHRASRGEAEVIRQAVTPSSEVPVVVIAAAVAAAIGRPHRVVKVKPVVQGWSLEGRRQLLVSHQLR